MMILLVISSILLAGLGFVMTRKWLNPITVFAGYWGVLGFISSFGLFGFYVPSDRAYSVIWLGVLGFSCGALTMVTLPKLRNCFADGFIPDAGRDNLRVGIIYVLYAVLILYSGVRVMTALRMLLSGYSFSVIRNLYFSEENEITASSLTGALDAYVFKTITMALIPISIADYFSEKRHKFLMLLALTAAAISVIGSGGRAVILYFIISSVVTLMMNRGRYRLSVMQIALILLFAIAAAAAVYFVTLSRKANIVFAEEAYRYFAGAVTQFDMRLQEFDKNPAFNYGLVYTRGLTLPFIAVFKYLLHFNYPDWYVQASSVVHDLQTSIKVGNGVYMKAFSTLFYYFYADGGYIGVVLLSAVYGLFSMRSFRDTVKRTTTRNIAIYALIVQGILMSMVRWQFYIPGYALAFLLIEFVYTAKEPVKWRFINA
ncbi:MAG: oligosaccharide repeat unit polymerase [Lachnospiraceae bacterium]|nr:oligosaccharide repeat unit polymerase [Lachnospiraceae bacterium]